MLRVSRSVPTPILRLQLEESQGPFPIGPCSTLFAQLEVAPSLQTLYFLIREETPSTCEALRLPGLPNVLDPVCK